ncbi:MAG TPA: hypothetical protein VMB05_12800, partial [Solirubrobacteraceae bacterium]|nr:hypothetical protein [Solirubrobacteraceae bacterium]
MQPRQGRRSQAADERACHDPGIASSASPSERLRWSRRRLLAVTLVVLTASALALASASATGEPGHAKSWGRNKYGELGNGSNTTGLTPTSVLTISEVRAMSAGATDGIAALIGGTAWAWGRNNHAELGNNSTTEETSPVQVANLKHVQAVAAGEGFTLAVERGKVFAWGDNKHRQVVPSAPTTEVKEAPVEVPFGTKEKEPAVQVAAGDGQSLALFGGGKIWGWGSDKDGDLGNAATKEPKEPVEVQGFVNATAVAAGASFGLAIEAEKVFAWGENRWGQLGNGTTEKSTTRVEVHGLKEVIAIAAGENHALAVEKNGSVWAWGQDTKGETGNGTVEKRTKEPVDVSSLPKEAFRVAAGDTSSMALMDNGAVYAWGENPGNGTTTSDKPIDVTGITPPSGSITSGESFEFASEALAPIDEVLPEIHGEPTDEAKLTATWKGWWSQLPPKYTYQWKECNSSGEGCSPLSSAAETAQTETELTVEHGEVGSTLRIYVKAKNAAGESEARSNATAVVVAKAPQNVSPPTIVGEARDE